jgi:hypothetical protein
VLRSCEALVSGHCPLLRHLRDRPLLSAYKSEGWAGPEADRTRGEQRLQVSDSPGPPVVGPTWPLPPSSPRSPQAGPATRPSTRPCFAAPALQAASDRLPTTGPRLPSTRRAMPITRILSVPPLPRLCRAHVPPSASSGRCAGARRRAGRARHAVAAFHWSLWTSLMCVANWKRPGRGYRFVFFSSGVGASGVAERGGAGRGWAGNEGAGSGDLRPCSCGVPLVPLIFFWVNWNKTKNPGLRGPHFFLAFILFPLCLSRGPFQLSFLELSLYVGRIVLRLQCVWDLIYSFVRGLSIQWKPFAKLILYIVSFQTLFC